MPDSENEKKIVWLVDDLKENRDQFKAAFGDYFTTKTFAFPEAVLKALKDKKVKLPNALLCDIFFYRNLKDRKKIEEIVKEEAINIRKLAKWFDDLVVQRELNKPSPLTIDEINDDIKGGIALVNTIKKDLFKDRNMPFPIFAYTTKGPYLLATDDFDKIEKLHMRWLFKKGSLADHENELRLYRKTLIKVIDDAIKEHEILTVWRSNYDYFSQFKGGDFGEFFLLQVDIANHTDWFAENQKKKHPARKELAKILTDELLLRDYDFHRLFWAGDGGMFVRTVEKTDIDVVIHAADRIYELFENWKKRHEDIGTKVLDIRVSAHKAPIFADSDPGLWSSTDLNKFAKNERSIAGEGFAITEEIWKSGMLDPLLKARFTEPVPIKDKNGNVIVDKNGNPTMRVCYDSKHKLIPRSSN